MIEHRKPVFQCNVAKVDWVVYSAFGGLFSIVPLSIVMDADPNWLLAAYSTTRESINTTMTYKGMAVIRWSPAVDPSAYGGT